MRIFIILAALLLPISVSAYTTETNQEKVEEIRSLVLTSGHAHPERAAENDNYTQRSLEMYIGEMYVEAKYFRKVESGELAVCDLTYQYEDVYYLYRDVDCNGVALKLLYENGSWSDEAIDVSVAEYARVLNVMYDLFSLVKNLNKDVADARLTILPDYKNMDETLRVMQNMVYVFEDFPEFNHDGGIIVNSKTGLSQGSKYTFGVSLLNYRFYFQAIKRPNTKYEECLFYRTNANGENRSWWDPDCDGAYEYYSEYGNERFLRPKDEGSYVALMMLGLMQQTSDFMKVYAELLDLPR